MPDHMSGHKSVIPQKYQQLIEFAPKLRKRGTPCRCKKCGWTTKIRLKRGVNLKNSAASAVDPSGLKDSPDTTKNKKFGRETKWAANGRNMLT